MVDQMIQWHWCLWVLRLETETTFDFRHTIPSLVYRYPFQMHTKLRVITPGRNWLIHFHLLECTASGCQLSCTSENVQIEYNYIVMHKRRRRGKRTEEKFYVGG